MPTLELKLENFNLKFGLKIFHSKSGHHSRRCVVFINAHSRYVTIFGANTRRGEFATNAVGDGWFVGPHARAAAHNRGGPLRGVSFAGD